MRTETRTNQPFSKSGLGANRLKLFLLFIHIVPDLFHWRIHAFERRLFIRNRPPTPRQSLSSFSFFFSFSSVACGKSGLKKAGGTRTMPTPTNHFLSCHYNNEVFVQTCTFPSVGNTAAEWTAAKRKDVMITTDSFMVKVVPSLISEININLLFFNHFMKHLTVCQE